MNIFVYGYLGNQILTYMKMVYFFQQCILVCDIINVFNDASETTIMRYLLYK